MPTPIPTPTPQGTDTDSISARTGSPAPASVATIDPAEIDGFDQLSEPVRELIQAALELTKRNLTYLYGSSDPLKGGMDCSGTIYLLSAQGFTNVPRDASEQYAWARRQSRLYPVLSRQQDNFELGEMRPGDLLFWTGTYHVDRDPPVTHTMIYLGRRKSDGHRLMFGSSDGRTYDGQKRNGVSVFDFRMPAARAGDPVDATTAAAPDHAPDFAAYGPIPGMADLADAARRQSEAEREQRNAPERAEATGGTRGSRARAGDDDAKNAGPTKAGGKAKATPSPTPRHKRTHASDDD
jgi:hypothetical protein